MDLVGAAEIAQMLGVSTRQVSRLTRQPQFPHPVAELAMGKVWRRKDIARWEANYRRRPGRPEKPYPPKK